MSEQARRAGYGESSPGTGRGGRWVGTAMVRREDPALLTGRGQYVDDVDLPGTQTERTDDAPRDSPPGGPLHAFVVRSPVAHARIASVDVSGARAADGVVAVLTAADLDAAGGGPPRRRRGRGGGRADARRRGDAGGATEPAVPGARLRQGGVGGAAGGAR